MRRAPMGASVGGEPNSWGIGKWRAYNLGGCRGVLKLCYCENYSGTTQMRPGHSGPNNVPSHMIARVSSRSCSLSRSSSASVPAR
jgi:hypothetical protein